jgi:hypothetical protein
MTETEAKWADRVRQWKASRKTREEFSMGQPFKSSTLGWWATELRRRAALDRRGSAGERSSDTIRMAQVVRVGTRRPSSSGLVLEVSGARIAIERGFDADLLSEVVRAIGGAR